MPSSINHKWGVPVFLACLAYECFKPVGRENVILFASFPRLPFFYFLYEFTKTTARRQFFRASMMRQSVSVFHIKHKTNHYFVHILCFTFHLHWKQNCIALGWKARVSILWNFVLLACKQKKEVAKYLFLKTDFHVWLIHCTFSRLSS
jgi:hypothetical protein